MVAEECFIFADVQGIPKVAGQKGNVLRIGFEENGRRRVEDWCTVYLVGSRQSSGN